MAGYSGTPLVKVRLAKAVPAPGNVHKRDLNLGHQAVK